jgi:hypothetical protein
LSNEQCPPRHCPEQHCDELEHVSPRIAQLVTAFESGVHVFVVVLHALLQQSASRVQLVPSALQMPAVEHVPPLQSRLQHALAALHEAPALLHMFGWLHRFTPSTSRSHEPEQQSAFALHVSFVRRHELAGTSHVPPTQLPEQQSVLFVHDWW